MSNFLATNRATRFPERVLPLKSPSSAASTMQRCFFEAFTSLWHKNWSYIPRSITAETMKKLFLLLFILPVTWSVSQAMNDEPAAMNRTLPDKAVQFIEKHFPNDDILQISTEYARQGESYEVKLENGFELTFDKQGHWVEVDGEMQSVPHAIIPGKIADYIHKHYAGERIVSIENEDQHYEVRLSGGQELTFERNGKFSGREN